MLDAGGMALVCALASTTFGQSTNHMHGMMSTTDMPMSDDVTHDQNHHMSTAVQHMGHTTSMPGMHHHSTTGHMHIHGSSQSTHGQHHPQGESTDMPGHGGNGHDGHGGNGEDHGSHSGNDTDHNYDNAQDAAAAAMSLGCSFFEHNPGHFMPCSSQDAFNAATGMSMDHTNHASHGESDHSAHDGAHAGHGTYFEASQTVPHLLFEGWTVTTNGEYTGALIAIFLIAFVFQAIKNYVRPKIVATLATDQDAIPVISLCHAVDSLLYGLQVVLGYFVMLIAMTFNAGVFAAIVIGSMAGYFVFATPREVLIYDSDCCQ